MTSAVWGLGIAVFVATVVEVVEALTIVLAMGMTRGWRSAMAGTVAALGALVVFTAAAGYALASWLPEAVLQLTIGTLLLIFGLQWLRTAILRSSGRKALHDEAAAFEEQAGTARAAERRNRFGLDWFGFVVSFKGVFLEGVEVVFIVLTFGLNAENLPVAVTGAVIGALLVLALGAAVRTPLSRVPENTLKYGVGLLLATFGTFWAIEGLGVLAPDGESLRWPGSDVFLLALLVGWLAVSRVLIEMLRRPMGPARGTTAPTTLQPTRGEA
jgi:Ca2+/H+ antiporter, TMEM165/GDT1 family